MNVTNEDFDTIDPHVRKQLLEESSAAWVQARWDERLAQRGHLGKVLDLPPAVKASSDEPEPYQLTKEQMHDLAFSAILTVLLCLLVLGFVIYALAQPVVPR